jgi:hypothetical protein
VFLFRRTLRLPNEQARRMDPISPELVLVDPDLAGEARARLGDPRESNGRVSPSHISHAVPRRRIAGAGAVARPVPSTVRLPIVSRPKAPVAGVRSEALPHHVVRPKLLLVAVGLVGFILGVVLPPIGSEGDRAPSRKPLASGDKQPVSTIPPSTTPAGATVHRDVAQMHARPRTAKQLEPPAAFPVKKKERLRQSKISEPASSPPIARRRTTREPTRARVPTRLFVWLPSRRASYYHVRFLKDTRTVFEAWPTDPRVSVPLRGTFRGRSFAFTNGRYRWIVEPAFGPRSEARYGEPIVRSIWIVRT